MQHCQRQRSRPSDPPARKKFFQYQNAQAVGIPARAKASIEYQWKAQRMPKCVTWICAKRCHTLSWWYVLFYPSLGAISGRRAAAQVLTPATKICGFVTSFAPFIYLVKPGLVSACQHDAGQCRQSPHNPTAWASWWPSIDVPQFTMVPFQPWGLSRAARDAKVDEAKLRQRAHYGVELFTVETQCDHLEKGPPASRYRPRSGGFWPKCLCEWPGIGILAPKVYSETTQDIAWHCNVGTRQPYRDLTINLH